MITGSDSGDGLNQIGGPVNRLKFVILIIMGVILLAACNGAQDEALEMAEWNTENLRASW